MTIKKAVGLALALTFAAGCSGIPEHPTPNENECNAMKLSTGYVHSSCPAAQQGACLDVDSVICVFVAQSSGNKYYVTADDAEECADVMPTNVGALGTPSVLSDVCDPQ